MTRSIAVSSFNLHGIASMSKTRSISAMSLGEEELPKSGLSYDWTQLEGLAERGASGRLIVGPGVLTRADLDFNWDVVATSMEYLGARPGIDQLQDEVQLFFQRTKMRCRKAVTGH